MTAPSPCPSITVVIITFNEEIHIGRCIDRIRPLAERIVVVDSYSTDRTVEIARAKGADVYQNAFTTHAAQRNWALDNCGIATDWILRIDSDEYLEPALIDVLMAKTAALPANVSAVDLKLKVIFRGKFLRWGGYYRTWITAMWRRGHGRIEARFMDERVAISGGRIIRLTGGDLVDENLKDIGWWTAKHNGYATRQMIDFILREHGLHPDADGGEAITPAAQFKRFLRSRVFGRAPLYLRSVLYFFLRYFVWLGFLDGRRGFVWHSLQGFWYFMLIDAKIDEARGFIREHGVDAFPAYVSERYGIALSLPVPHQ